MTVFEQVEAFMKERVAVHRREIELEQVLRERYGLTVPQADVLVMLHREPLTMGEIAGRLGTTSGNITNIIDRMEAKGLVRRSPKPDDRRCNLVELTEAGREYIHGLKSDV